MLLPCICTCIYMYIHTYIHNGLNFRFLEELLLFERMKSYIIHLFAVQREIATVAPSCTSKMYNRREMLYTISFQRSVEQQLEQIASFNRDGSSSARFARVHLPPYVTLSKNSQRFLRLEFHFSNGAAIIMICRVKYFNTISDFALDASLIFLSPVTEKKGGKGKFEKRSASVQSRYGNEKAAAAPPLTVRKGRKMIH